MAVSWSRPRDDEPGHPEHVFIVADVSVEPTVPGSVAIARVPLEPAPYAPSDELQEDDVIEPTAVFKPWVPGTDWDNVEITVEYYD